MQQGTGEVRIVAKSTPTLNLVSRSAAGSLTTPSSSASSRPGILTAPSQQGSNLTTQRAGKPAAGGSNQNDAASNHENSRCFCRHFLSDRKQNIMSWRAQEKRTEEVLVVAKPGPLSLISRSFSANQISHVEFGYIIQPRELQMRLEF